MANPEDELLDANLTEGVTNAEGRARSIKDALEQAMSCPPEEILCMTLHWVEVHGDETEVHSVILGPEPAQRQMASDLFNHFTKCLTGGIPPVDSSTIN